MQQFLILSIAASLAMFLVAGLIWLFGCHGIDKIKHPEEIKNYGGNIYGDANRPKWIQYIGHQKNFFYNPLLQNKNHAKHLKQFLAQDGIEIPIIPLISTISRGKWKVKNLKPGDYILGYNCHLKDIYENTPNSAAMAKHFKTILAQLTPLSRPSEDIKEKHIKAIKSNVPNSRR